MAGFDTVICDWMSGVHRYREPVKPFESGRVMKLDRDGVIEWEKMDWERIVCPSSDTSLRFRCDGHNLKFSGNIGRFQHKDNATGIGVLDCVARWMEVLKTVGLDVQLFGAVQNRGLLMESGTKLSRVDLAGNFDVSDYEAWCRHLMQRRLFTRHPRLGKYGPTWGYEAKRSNWWKAKVYDKEAELAGLRNSKGGKTLARFEVQLGSEYLKREGLDYVKAWAEEREGKDMGRVIYGQFLNELMREAPTVESWNDIPPRLRHYAVLWRDGQLQKADVSRSSWYRARARLLEYGIDIDVPCNVLSLSRHVRTVDVVQVAIHREAA